MGRSVYMVLSVPYIIIHFFLGRTFGLFSDDRTAPCTPCSACFVWRRRRTRVVKRRSTFCAVFAEVSRKSQPNCRDIAAPSSRETSRSNCLSHLLPTSMKTGFWRLTFSIA